MHQPPPHNKPLNFGIDLGSDKTIDAHEEVLNMKQIYWYYVHQEVSILPEEILDEINGQSIENYPTLNNF